MESRNFINTQAGWSEASNSAPVFDDEQRFWQFRISVFPSKKNLLKARAALENLFSTKKYANGNHPHTKIYLGEEYWDTVTEKPPIDSCVADRNQAGKEICVYMDWNSQKQTYQFSANDYKTLMLEMWKVLEDAGVELSYITPSPDEMELPSEQGIITPFFYSAYKPYNLERENVRHGILNSTLANPKGFENPLNGVTFTKSDLLKYKIHDGCAFVHSAKRNHFQQKRLIQAKEQITNHIQDLLARIDVLNEPQSQQFMKKIEMIVEVKDKTKFLKDCNELVQEMKSAHLPQKSDKSFSNLLNINEFNFYLKREDCDKLISLLNKLKNDIQDEMLAITKEMEDPWIKDFFAAINITDQAISCSIQYLPFQMQECYRWLMHIKHAEKSAEYEQMRYQKEKKLLSLSVISKFVIEIQDVKVLDDLIPIALHNKKPSSLFSLHKEDSQKTCGLIIKQFQKIISLDETNIFKECPDYKLIHHAAKYGLNNISYFLLLTAQDDVNARGEYDRTPLHIAVYNGHAQLVKTLIDKGANIDAISVDMNSALTPLAVGLEKMFINLMNVPHNLEATKRFWNYKEIVFLLVSREIDKEIIFKNACEVFPKLDKDQRNLFYLAFDQLLTEEQLNILREDSTIQYRRCLN